jgi:hypothetical protein
MYLAMKAMSEGCWVLVVMGINNTLAIEGLEAKFRLFADLIGVNVKMVTERIFASANAGLLATEFNALAEDGARSLWTCKANESQLGKLVAGVPEAAWSRCVVIFDEIHNFCSCDVSTKKKAEKSLFKMLFGADTDPKDYTRERLAVRSLILSDATDGDVVHLLKHMGYTAEQY